MSGIGQKRLRVRSAKMHDSDAFSEDVACSDPCGVALTEDKKAKAIKRLDATRANCICLKATSFAGAFDGGASEHDARECECSDE